MALTVVKRSLVRVNSEETRVELTMTGSDPAAGSQWSETVPAGKAWRLKAIYATLVTSAVVGNRLSSLSITDGTNTILLIPDTTNVAASLTAKYLWMPYGGGSYTPGVAVGVVNPLPEDFIVGPGYVLASTVSGMDAGDNWGAPVFTVEEFGAK